MDITLKKLLYFFYSAMNAGKTTALLQSRHNYHATGMKTLSFLPGVISQRSEAVIRSRIGIEAPCITFDRTFIFDTFIENHHQKETLSCIFVDEAQFLTEEQVWQLCRIVDELEIPVLTYGLRTDFQGRLFEGSTHLLALADKLVEIMTVCFCGSNATMVIRLDAQNNVVTQGGQVDYEGSRYISFCRKHYREMILNKKIAGVENFLAVR